ncbi:ribosomal protein S18 acetylase RimI-like enzyme [Friedmanniella endophytica]|uniref:Ribosomal protein S18 acetylase RimI-like enzyme n=1 Tax=Microlunatus kandeliicorticis TaxID=1759536 RepID=A0A7W3P5B3_9ACTN|nr:GNAT family N-acetyltransferase [Microlunatus kandeliicorticis]MBA8793786.1 ribosomal protein S18 acetylase RimI-like enzyme [Microlunatus kandeliicorticis]
MSLTERPLAETDLDAIMAMLHSYDLAYVGEPMMDAEDVLGEWQMPSFELARDTLGLVDDDGRLVGYASVDSGGTVEVTTDRELWNGPEEERLLDHAERHAAARGITSVRRFVAGADVEGQALMRRRGWSEAYTSWVLQLGPDDEIRTRELPPGYAVRPFAAEDAEEVHRVVAEAFSEWQQNQRSFEDWHASVVERPGADSTRFRVVTFTDPAGGDAPQIVGACVVFDGPEEAWVSQLAVARDHRHRGLAQRLLADTYRGARERGVARGGLSTDSRTGALGLYQRLGMTVFCEYRCFTRTLA